MGWFERIMLYSYAVLLFFAFSVPLPERSHWIEKTLKCWNDPCIITHNYGGVEEDFRAAAGETLLGRRKLVIIDGSCYSACTFVADELRTTGKVCITSKAVLGFHQGYTDGVPNSDYIPIYSPPVDAMVRNAGGYPEPKGMNYFRYKDLKDLWPTCGVSLLRLPTTKPIPRVLQLPPINYRGFH